MKSIVMASSMFQKTVNIPFFSDHCTENFFFTGEFVVENLFNPFVNIT